MSGSGYKKYMKKDVKKDKGNSLIMLFSVSFIVMFLVFYFLIQIAMPKVDTSCGGDRPDSAVEETVNIDGRLAAIQNEDSGRNFSDFIKDTADDKSEVIEDSNSSAAAEPSKSTLAEEMINPVRKDPIYKVFIGTYTSAEQAKVAKDIIQESGLNLNPIVKCIGSNNYTLQVGTFKNKVSADSLLASILQNHLPGRIVQDD